jgi:hypothetical protein
MTLSFAQWATGWDNSGNLQEVRQDLPVFSGSIYGADPATPNDSPGNIQIRADGLSSVNGYRIINWVFDLLTREQWTYIQTTYTVGGSSYSGKMTIRTLDEDNTYTNLNAYMYLPPKAQLERDNDFYLGVTISFRIVGAAA